ncbi:hypothetical protein V9T40_014360 [Parthenolecanium corni]|uniref:Uncharacterized protein n=1 Tax=Parthenolecanium corni TaxID=536013 RepID=A0AAN9XXA3_9HEMI
MKEMFVFLIIFQFLCHSVLITANRTTLPIISDFKPSELANLTSQEEHKLQLRALLDKEMGLTIRILMLELLAKNSGNEFYGFMDDENANRECTAIIKAIIECLGKLKVQNNAERVLELATFKWASRYIKQADGDLGKALSLLCSGMNEELENETVYKALRDENKKSESWRPKKILLYSIPKSENELKKAVAEVYNAPQAKKYDAHMAYIKSDPSSTEEQSIKLTISNLIKVPGKLELVQKIYDQVIIEWVSQTEDIAVDKIDIGLRGDQPEESSIALFRKLKEKIDANPDLNSSITTTESSAGNTFRISALRLVIVLITADRFTYPIVSHFEPSKLANLTSQEEHKLQLRDLLDKDMGTTVQILMLELMAKNSGNEFYGFMDDENANRECTAIIKATFECLGKLKIQNHAEDVLEVAAFKWIMRYVGQARGDLGKALSLLCSGMNEELENETVYKALRDENKKSESWRPKKILLYSIPKSENELQKAFAEVYNAPQTKKFAAHMAYIKSNTSSTEEQSVKLTISNLIKVPGKLEMVQKIYDQVILEFVSQTEDIAVDKINIEERGVRGVQQKMSSITLFRKLKEKIDANPDLKSSITTTESSKVR